jgi:hypothetical protein
MKTCILVLCMFIMFVFSACKGSIHNSAATDTSGKTIQNPNDSSGSGNIINKDSTSTDPGDGTPSADTNKFKSKRTERAI